jgi:dTDP-4-amino-4,6-dideoxygalactose transaminase
VNKRAAPNEATEAALALNGGTSLRTQPFAPWPVFAEDERRASDAVLASGRVNYWTGGECGLFEQEFAKRAGCEHAIALANGTLALELALRALGIGAGDDVITPSKTFIASASCAVAVGARPVVCDVDPDSQNLTAETVRAALTPGTRAVVAVHLAGWPCELEPLAALCREKGIALVEDCAQAHGAAYRGRPVGSTGVVSAFSFCQDKIMTTGGEGGMLVTNDRALWLRAWAYKDHGKSWASVFEREHPPGFRWQHEGFGSNFRLTEMQAAIGRVQLGKLDDWVAARRRNAAALIAGLKGVPALRVPLPPAHIFHSYYRVYAQVDPAGLREGWDTLRVIEAINREGIPCQQGGCSEIYRERAFVDAGLAPEKPLPVASRLSETSLVFLVHPTLAESDMRDAAQAVAKVMRVAARA